MIQITSQLYYNWDDNPHELTWHPPCKQGICTQKERKVLLFAKYLEYKSEIHMGFLISSKDP